MTTCNSIRGWRNFESRMNTLPCSPKPNNAATGFWQRETNPSTEQPVLRKHWAPIKTWRRNSVIRRLCADRSDLGSVTLSRDAWGQLIGYAITALMDRKYTPRRSDERERRRSSIAQIVSIMTFRKNRRSHGMYGPPLRRKRNLRVSQVGLRKCIRPLLEWITPGQDGMRCALFPTTISVLKDFFRVRVLRAPGSTVVPSPHSPADLAGNHDLRSRRQPVAGESGCSCIGQDVRPILFILSEHGPGYAGELIR